MKRTSLSISLAILIAFALLSCKKEKTDVTYKVTYSVTGNNVNQFKITQTAVTDILVETPFSGTRDTTVFLSAGTDVKLDTKANNNNLAGSIYVNDILKATATDPDLDGDGKTEVKLEYLLPIK